MAAKYVTIGGLWKNKNKETGEEYLSIKVNLPKKEGVLVMKEVTLKEGQTIYLNDPRKGKFPRNAPEQLKFDLKVKVEA